MCANFKTLKREHAHQLDLFEPTFDYKSDVYPSDDCPMILSHQNEWEWRKVKFGMLPPYAKEITFKYATYNARTETVEQKRSFKHAWSNDQFGLFLLKLFMNLNISMVKHIGMAYSVKMESHLRLQQFMKKP
jgi:hypothetical protein